MTGKTRYFVLGSSQLVIHFSSIIKPPHFSPVLPVILDCRIKRNHRRGNALDAAVFRHRDLYNPASHMDADSFAAGKGRLALEASTLEAMHVPIK
jgi:hypothetical protein